MKTDIYPRFSLATIDRAASRRTCAAPTRRHIFMQTVLPDSLSNAETTNPDLFEITPTSLWLEDYSQLRVLFRSEEHTSELQSLMRISYAVFCLKKKKIYINNEERNVN